MAVGDWHVFGDGYRFRETLFGPMTTTSCVDCGEPTLIVQDIGRGQRAWAAGERADRDAAVLGLLASVSRA